jgi:1,4-dihydroxy-2-naphthoyl-CoA synthase
VREVVNEKDYDKLKIENINKSRMQIKLNFPEVNPAFDTYRLGTVLEMVKLFHHFVKFQDF